MRVVPLTEDATPKFLSEASLKLNKNKTWIAGTGAFVGVFGTLCVFFDPTMAFALSLVVITAVKN